MTTHEVIQLNGPTSAFYAGASVAGKMQERVVELLPDGTPDQRLALFWTLVGRRSAEFETQEGFDSFIMGAASCAPARQGVFVEFTTTSPEFHKHDPETAGYDYEQDDRDFRMQVAQVMARVRLWIQEGLDSREIRDRKGRVIGRFYINDSEERT